MDQTARLSGDELAEVLRRVPLRWLAASRCVCKAWRAAVDGGGLLRADLLPPSVAGLFFHFNEHLYPEFLSCPRQRSSAAAGAPAPVSGRIDFLRRANPRFSGDPGSFGHWWDDEAVDYIIEHHCNGLLLLPQWVANPATGRWTTLPPSPIPAKEDPENDVLCYRRFLAYDPTVSPHFEVFMIQCLKDDLAFGKKYQEDPSMGIEWPPSPCKMHVFSSRSPGRCWEERSFLREGDAAGTLSEMLAHVLWSSGAAVYLGGKLYVHCMSDYIMRISVADNTYRVIKTPVDTTGEEGYIQLDMGRSEKGLYFSWIRDGWLRVWILKESCTGEAEWILRHENDLEPMIKPFVYNRWAQGDGSWVLEDINYNLFRAPCSPKDDKKTIVQEKLERERDNGHDGVETEDIVEDFYLEDNENQDTGHDGVKSIVMVEDFYSEDNENQGIGHDGVKSEDMVEDLYSEDSEKATVVENVNSNFTNDDALGNRYRVEDCYLLDGIQKAKFEKNTEWNSNNGTSLNSDQKAKEYSYWETQILGFHPYKEIIFLSESFQTGLAYHLNSSKMEVLGNIYPTRYVSFKELANERESFQSSFVYTPCQIDEFRDSRSSSSQIFDRWKNSFARDVE